MPVCDVSGYLECINEADMSQCYKHKCFVVPDNFFRYIMSIDDTTPYYNTHRVNCTTICGILEPEKSETWCRWIGNII